MEVKGVQPEPEPETEIAAVERRVEELMKYTLRELKPLCGAAGVSPGGIKEQVVQRLVQQEREERKSAR